MKLLIVDDQIYVAQGLRFGIDWKAEDFSEVFIALNALEARTVLQKNAVDVMLCDISYAGCASRKCPPAAFCSLPTPTSSMRGRPSRWM